MQELCKEPIALDAASCFLIDGCGRFSQVFRELILISIDIQPHADHLKRLRSCSRSTFAENAADLAFAEEDIIRPFYCNASCGNQFDGFSRSQGSQQREPREPLSQPIMADRFSDNDGAIEVDARGRKPLPREPAATFRLGLGHYNCTVLNTNMGESDRLSIR